MNQKAENLRERLLDVSMKQFLKKEYTGATTMEIARLAGVSKGALYWHLKNEVGFFLSLIMGVNVVLAMTLHPLMIYAIKPKFISRGYEGKS